MKTFVLLVMGALCIALGCILIKSNAQTPSNCPSGCCCPPNGNNPRFAKGSTVTVYIDSSSGFTETEIQMLREGMEDWNDETNNSGVHFNVVVTATPPPIGGNNTIVAHYNPNHSSSTVVTLPCLGPLISRDFGFSG